MVQKRRFHPKGMQKYNVLVTGGFIKEGVKILVSMESKSF